MDPDVEETSLSSAIFILQRWEIVGSFSIQRSLDPHGLDTDSWKLLQSFSSAGELEQQPKKKTKACRWNAEDSLFANSPLAVRLPRIRANPAQSFASCPGGGGYSLIWAI